MRGLRIAATRTLLAMPPALLRALSGGEVKIDGRVLQPQSQILMHVANKVGRLPVGSIPATEFREQTNRAMLTVSGPGPDMEDVWNQPIPGDGCVVPVRGYVPRTRSDGLLLYFHGGGFVAGNLDTHDMICRYFAELAGVLVIAVGYRLAPEHKFPAAVLDARAAFDWAVDNATELGIDPRKIAVGGDSSGANLATVLAYQTLTEDKEGPAFQMLLYPIVDLSQQRRSYQRFDERFGLTAEMCDWGVEQYLSDPAQQTDPLASPILAESLAGMPPAYIGTAGFDVLHDDGEDYAVALEQAGVEVEYRCHTGMVHGYARLIELVDAARKALEESADAVRRGLEA